MALEFGSKKVRVKSVKKELFPNEAVLTMLPVDGEKEGRGAKKFQFNSTALELLNINHVDKGTGVRTNEEISFTREPITNEEKTKVLGYNYFIFVNNTGSILAKDENGEQKEFKILSNKVTVGDSTLANTPRYDQIAETYQLNTTLPHYFKLIKSDRTDINVTIYQLNKIMPETTENKTTVEEVVNQANHEMEEMTISIN